MYLINNHFKTFLISLLSLTLLFSISCSDAYKPSDKDGTRTLSYYAGDWWGSPEEEGEATVELAQKIFTINANGSVIIIFANNKEIPSTSITKNSDTSYTYYDATENSYMHFNFTSDTEGTMTAGVNSENSMSVKVTKR